MAVELIWMMIWWMCECTVLGILCVACFTADMMLILIEACGPRYPVSHIAAWCMTVCVLVMFFWITVYDGWVTTYSALMSHRVHPFFCSYYEWLKPIFSGTYDPNASLPDLAIWKLMLRIGIKALECLRLLVLMFVTCIDIACCVCLLVIRARWWLASLVLFFIWLRRFCIGSFRPELQPT